jgi:hypothetical protein
MRFKYYNPNQKNLTSGDCVIRMLTVITDKSWDDCYWLVCERGAEMGEMPSANVVWMSILTDLGFKRYVIPNTCPNCYTIKDFCKDHPEGLYVLATGSHVVAVKDGCYLDSWNSGNEHPIFYFKRN